MSHLSSCRNGFCNRRFNITSDHCGLERNKSQGFLGWDVVLIGTDCELQNPLLVRRHNDRIVFLGHSSHLRHDLRYLVSESMQRLFVVC